MMNESTPDGMIPGDAAPGADAAAAGADVAAAGAAPGKDAPAKAPRPRKFPAFPDLRRPRPPRGGPSGPLPRAGTGMLGVELTRQGLRFVELKRSGRSVVLRNFGEIDRDPEADLGQVLQVLLRERDIQARDIQVVDSVSRANLKIQSMPKIPPKELDLILRGEIASEGELLGEEMVGDWCPLQTRGEEVEVLIGKIPLGERTTLENACEKAGLRLRALTTSSIVLARHLQLTKNVPPDETVAVLDTGRAKTNMALVSSDAIQLVREVYQGVSGQIFSGDAAEVTDLDAITAGLDEVVGTVQQIRRTWEQFCETRPGAVMHHVVMTGETTRVDSLIGLVQHDLQVPVKTYDPSAQVPGLPPEFVGLASSFALPWVLATTPTHDIVLNFAEKIIDRRPAKVALGVAAVAAAGCLAVGTLQFLQSGAEEDAEAALASAEAAKASVEVELGIMKEVQQDWEAFLRNGTREGGLPTPDPRPHLAEIVRVLPEEIRLTRVALLRNDGALILQADARAVSKSATASHAAMEAFVHALGDSRLVRRVSMEPIEYQHDRGRRDEVGLEFALEAEVNPVVVGEPPPVTVPEEPMEGPM